MKRYASPQAGTFIPLGPTYGRTGGQFLVDRKNCTPSTRSEPQPIQQPAKPTARKPNHPQLAAVLDAWSAREIWRTGLNEYWLSRGDGTLLRLSGLLEAQELAREHGVNLL